MALLVALGGADDRRTRVMTAGEDEGDAEADLGPTPRPGLLADLLSTPSCPHSCSPGRAVDYRRGWVSVLPRAVVAVKTPRATPPRSVDARLQGDGDDVCATHSRPAGPDPDPDPDSPRTRAGGASKDKQ